MKKQNIRLRIIDEKLRIIIIIMLHYQYGFPDPLSPPCPIVHHFCQVLWATSRIGTELVCVYSCWSSCLCTSMLRDPQEYITYELIPTSSAVSRMSGSCAMNLSEDISLQNKTNKKKGFHD